MIIPTGNEVSTIFPFESSQKSPSIVPEKSLFTIISQSWFRSVIGSDSGVFTPLLSQKTAIFYALTPFKTLNLKNAYPWLSVNSIVLVLSIATLGANAFAFSKDNYFVAKLPKNYEGRSL